MKITFTFILCTALAASTLYANPSEKPAVKNDKESADETLAKHGKGAKKLATEQDDLSADVQDLIDEQTDPKVIELLRAVEVIMADATDQLEQKDTGGATIATQTEVIEKIFEAAKKKQQGQNQQGQGKPQQGGMMEMLKNMMEGGKDAGKDQGESKGKKPGKGEGPGGGGKGSGGEAGGNSGDPDNTAEGGQRRVPKNSGSSGSTLPREFQKAMDAYNKGAAKKSNQR